MGNRRLYRSKSDKYIAGVAGGLADYFSLDPVLVRVIMTALAIFGGSGFIIYLLIWVFVPESN